MEDEDENIVEQASVPQLPAPISILDADNQDIPPEMRISTLPESHQDFNTSGFISNVSDESVKKYVFRSKSKTVVGVYDTVTIVIREVHIMKKTSIF